MRILALCSYPVEAAATRYRLIQFIEPLAKDGITLEVRPFLDSSSFNLLYRQKSPVQRIAALAKPLFNRLTDIFRIRQYDLLLIQREAMFFGPAFFEWIFQKLGDIPMILDLDDATYISYVSPTYGRLGSFFKFFGKTDKLIARADRVICGNRFIAEHVARKKTPTVVIPTVVDTNKFFPVEKTNKVPVVGWVGTHSTFPFLQSIFPVLQKLAGHFRFKLKIIGAGRNDVKIDGVEVENIEWNLEREAADFQSFDIGLYPMELGNKIPDEWIAGKSGFKAIQYMAIGIPFVMTPVGVCAEIGSQGATHFAAVDFGEWEQYLSLLLGDETLRRKMGANGRNHVLKNYTVEMQSAKLIEVLRLTLSRYY